MHALDSALVVRNVPPRARHPICRHGHSRGPQRFLIQPLNFRLNLINFLQPMPSTLRWRTTTWPCPVDPTTTTTPMSSSSWTLLSARKSRYGKKIIQNYCKKEKQTKQNIRFVFDFLPKEISLWVLPSKTLFKGTCK
jgi:hypothetical protein